MNENYLNDLKDAVYKRLDSYGVEEGRKYVIWTNLRTIISLHLKKDTGEALVKGNRPVRRDQYEKCLSYIDMILPQ